MSNAILPSPVQMSPIHQMLRPMANRREDALETKPCRYGIMSFFKNDTTVSRSLSVNMENGLRLKLISSSISWAQGIRFSILVPSLEPTSHSHSSRSPYISTKSVTRKGRQCSRCRFRAKETELSQLGEDPSSRKRSRTKGGGTGSSTC